MTNEELVLGIIAGENVEENEAALWLQNRGIIRQQARCIAGAFTGSEQARTDLQEELEQESFFGIRQAVYHWQPGSGAAFITYAMFWIRRAMLKYARETSGSIRVPAGRQRQAAEYKNMIREYRERFGRQPADQEIMELLQIDRTALEDLKAAAAARNCESIEKPIAEDITLSDTIQDQKDQYADLLEEMEAAELRAAVLEALADLPDLQALVVGRHYLAGMSLQRISRETGQPYSEIIKARDKGKRSGQNGTGTDFIHLFTV